MAWYDATKPSWMGAQWMDEITAWIDAALARSGHRRTGEVVPVHLRVWSGVCRAPTTGGDVFFKTAPPGIDFEPALLAFLDAQGIEGLRIVDIENERNWMLTWGEGETARQVYGGTPEGLAHWKLLLARYAGMQIGLSDRADALVAVGVPDLRLEQLPAQFDLLAECEHLSCGEDGLAEDEIRTFRTLRPKVEELCGRLAAVGIAETLQHNDLHDSNVFLRDGSFVIFDWGDASVAHPFFDCEVLFAVAKGRFGLEKGTAGFASFRDAYLGPFAEQTSMERALEALELSVPLAKLCRAMTWHRIIDMPGGEEAREIVARRAKILLGMLTDDDSVTVGASPYL